MEATRVEFASNVWKRNFPAGVRAALGMLAILFALACGSMPKPSFYTLQVPAAPAPAETRTNYILGVEHFRAPEILRDDRIIYYVSPTQINYYQHHRWGSDPATLLSDYTAEWLGSTGVFSQVKVLPMREHVDYTLGGRVLSFEEVDSDGGAKVRLSLALSLVRSSDHKLVWSADRRQESPLATRGVDGVATALNATCAQVMQEITPGLIAQVEQDFKSSGK
jgi:ABC-type uncharacterized transport system auxiliary subunit